MVLDKNQIRSNCKKELQKEFKDGYVVNLGIGLPTLVANYVRSSLDVIFQSENGCIGAGPAPEAGKEDKHLTNLWSRFHNFTTRSCLF